MHLDRKLFLLVIVTASSTAAAIILKVTYGYTVQEGKDPFVELAGKAMTVASLLATPGAFLVDIIPACKAKLEHLSS